MTFLSPTRFSISESTRPDMIATGIFSTHAASARRATGDTRAFDGIFTIGEMTPSKSSMSTQPFFFMRLKMSLICLPASFMLLKLSERLDKLHRPAVDVVIAHGGAHH